MIKIRLAEETDIEDGLELIKEFTEESLKDYGAGAVNPEQIKAVFKLCIGSTLVVEKDGLIVGTVAGIVNNFPSDGSKVYQEIIWYVSKAYRKYGVLLFRKLEEFCRAKGIKHIIMIHLANLKAAKLDRFYTRLGFKELETHYIKTL